MPFANLPGVKNVIIIAAYHAGRDAELGIYSSLCRSTSAPKDEKCLIKTNIDKATYEKFYHFPGCKHYEFTIVEEDIGEGYFCTEKEAQLAGFTKASGCVGKEFGVPSPFTTSGVTNGLLTS